MERARRIEPLLSHAIGWTLLLYLVLRGLAPVDPAAPSGALDLLSREGSALAQATLLTAVAALLAAAIGARRPALAPALFGGLTGLVLGYGVIDSRFVLYFGRHLYHPDTADLVFSPGLAEHSGVGMTRIAIWTAAWIVTVLTLGWLGRAARDKTLPVRVAVVIAGALALNAVRDASPVPARAAWLEHYREGLLFRGFGGAATGAARAGFTYPRGALGPPRTTGERPDVLLVVIESLRADALDAETMPALFARSRSPSALVAERHYAGANCTANSWFTIVYGTNGTAFAHFTDPARPVPSAPIAWLRASGYRTEMFTSESLVWQHMGELFFEPGFDTIVVDEDGEVWERDARLVDHYFEQPHGTEPRFSVIFFTSSHHDYAFPPDRAPFQPSLSPLDVMGTDLRPYRAELHNRYRNSVSWVDALVGRLLDRLEQEGRLAHTRVIVTGDHGEELLEHGHLTHASSLVEEQIHVPFVALGVPGLAGRTRAPTSHAQILPTLLASISPGLDFAASGTGTPIGMDDARELPIVSECAADPGMFVAIESAQKDWLTIGPDAIRLDFVSDERDVVRADASASPETIARVRAAADAFGGERAFEGELWPCPTVESEGDTFHLCGRWIAWPEASALCESHGLALATFTSEAQARAVAAAATAGEHESAWIGLTDREVDGEFRWASGAAPAFTPWAEGEPTNENGREHCVQAQRGGAWITRACESRDVFVCGPRR
jgi:hypothetical protein